LRPSILHHRIFSVAVEWCNKEKIKEEILRIYHVRHLIGSVLISFSIDQFYRIDC